MLALNPLLGALSSVSIAKLVHFDCRMKPSILKEPNTKSPATGQDILFSEQAWMFSLCTRLHCSLSSTRRLLLYREWRKWTKKEKGGTRKLFVGCFTSQQHASVSQGRICTDNFTCCHTEIKVADPTFHLIQSQFTDTRPTSPSTDPTIPGAWQGSHWSANWSVNF